MSPAHTKLENEPGLEVWYSSELIFSSVEQKTFFLIKLHNSSSHQFSFAIAQKLSEIKTKQN